MTDEERFERFWRRFEKFGGSWTKNDMRDAFLASAGDRPFFRNGEIVVIEDAVRSRITYLPDSEIGLARKLSYEEVATILAPPEAKYCAVDGENNIAFFYHEEPIREPVRWKGDCLENEHGINYSFNWNHPDWENSLFKLPGVV